MKQNINRNEIFRTKRVGLKLTGKEKVWKFPIFYCKAETNYNYEKKKNV